MKKSTKFKCALIGAGIVGGACAFVGRNLVEAFLGKKVLSNKSESRALLSESNAYALNNSEEIMLGKEFYRSTPHVRLTIQNRTGEDIHSLFYKNVSGSNVYVICCHGYGSCASSNAHLAMHFYELGYNILMPHMRAHPGSDHKYCTMGWFERLDIVDWAEFLAETNKDCKIILHGLSMGAATVMMATGEKLPKEVVCAIEDCGYTSMYDEYRAQIGRVMHLPPFPALNIFRASAKRIVGFDMNDASAIDQVRKSVTPTLFMHGSADDFVPFSMLDELYCAASCEKERVVFEGAEHATSSIMYPTAYWNKIKQFIKKYI